MGIWAWSGVCIISLPSDSLKLMKHGTNTLQVAFIFLFSVNAKLKCRYKYLLSKLNRLFKVQRLKTQFKVSFKYYAVLLKHNVVIVEINQRLNPCYSIPSPEELTTTINLHTIPHNDKSKNVFFFVEIVANLFK